MLTKVRLLGELGRVFGREWNLYISSPAQAIRAIAANRPEFMEYLYESDNKGITYRVIIDDPQGIDESQLQYPVSDQLIIAPIIRGAGGGLGKVILGGALLVGSFFMPAAIPLFGASISSFAIGALGASLLLSGVTQMLTPVPKTPKAEPRTNSDPPKSNSYLFDRAAELGDQGQSVPIPYGERVWADLIILSSSITTQEIAIG